MDKFTSEEISFIRHHVEDAIKAERKTIKTYEDGFKRNSYTGGDKEYAESVLKRAREKMDNLYTLLSKVDAL